MILRFFLYIANKREWHHRLSSGMNRLKQKAFVIPEKYQVRGKAGESMNAICVENLSKVYRTRVKEEGLKASFRALF